MRCMVGYKTAITVNYWFQEILFLFLKRHFLVFQRENNFFKIIFPVAALFFKKTKN